MLLSKHMGQMATVIVVLTWFLVSGCGGSAYPGEELRKEKQPPPPANFYIELEDVMKMTEGRISEFKVVGVVPAPGTPTVTAERLPEGATFSNDGILQWTPKFTDVSLTEDQDGFRSFRVRFTLSSSQSSESFVQRSALIFVRLDSNQRIR